MQTLKQIIAEAPTAAEAIEATKRYREYEREAKSIYIPLWDYWMDALSPGDKRCDAFRKAFCEYSGAKYGAPITLMFIAFCGGVGIGEALANEQ